MLQSLKIKNYRNIKDLTINSLSRINLITGKNNTGKSTLLEAVSLYASECDTSWIYQLLDDRGENYRSDSNDLNSTEANIKTFSSLFINRTVSFLENDAISIGVLDGTMPVSQLSKDDSISIRFVKFTDKEVTNSVRAEPGSNFKKISIIQDDEIDNVIDFSIGLEIRNGNRSRILPLEGDRASKYNSFRNLAAINKLQFINTRSIDRDVNGKLWDSIALTEKENFIIEALRIIEPDIDRLAYVGENGRERTTVVKLKNDNNILPLKCMGDGINRVLTIILALVNADNGFLLIDEFENGLHYSVQEQLWKIILKLSKDLNIQVFATTHSEDCIKGFESVLNKDNNTREGKLIRLENVDGKIKQTEFDALELKIASKNDIEIR